MSIPKVISIKKKHLVENGHNTLVDWLQDSDHMYIGRNMSFYVPGATASKWKNPYNLKKYSLEESLELYEEHIRSTPDLINAIPELKGKTLGCWCKPNKCHGDILVKLYLEQNNS